MVSYFEFIALDLTEVDRASPCLEAAEIKIALPSFLSPKLSGGDPDANDLFDDYFDDYFG